MMKKFLIIVGFLLLMFGMVYAVPSDTNLVAWFKLNETSGRAVYNAKAGPDINGYLVGTNYILGNPGINGTNYSLFSTGTHIDSNASMGTGGTKHGTIAAWIKTTNANNADGIISQRVSGFSGILMSGANEIAVYLNITTNFGSTGANINNGLWRFVVVTQDDTSYYLYVDGQRYATGAAVNWQDGLFRIGEDVGGAATTFDGNIDEVSIWSWGLSSADVNYLYNSRSGLTYCGSGYLNTFDTTCIPSGPLDINLTNPTSGIISGSQNVIFNIYDGNSLNTIDVNVWVGATPGAHTQLLIHDTNLADASGITCDAYIPFSIVRTCTYVWNTSLTPDGNYYIDVIAKDTNGQTDNQSSGLLQLNNAGTPDSFDTIPPTVGQTTLTGFTTYTGFIQGIGNVIGGIAFDTPDYNYGSSFTIIRIDQNNIGDICTSSDGSYVYASVAQNSGFNGSILKSSNYGVDWNAVGSSRDWTSISCSSTGQYVFASATGQYLADSNDYGVTWTSRAPTALGSIPSSAMSSTGQYMVATVGLVGLNISSDYGVTFTQTGPMIQLNGVSMSADGNYIFAVAANGYIYVSSNRGATWTEVQNGGSRKWESVSMSRDGKYGVATTYFSDGHIAYTQNYGLNWTISPNIQTYTAYRSAMSYSGTYVIIPVLTGQIMGSHDFGVDYNLYNSSGKYWIGAAISDNRYAYVTQALQGATDGYIYRQVRDKRGIDPGTCEYTDNNGSTWQPADWNNGQCTKYGITIIPGQNYIFNTRVRDFTGNTGYGISTGLYSAAVGSAITIYVQDESTNPIEGVDLNIFSITNGIRTFYATATSDVTGTAIVFLNVGQTYGIDVIKDGVIVKTTDNLLVSTSPYYITIPTSSTGIVVPDVNQIYVTWNPSSDFIYSDVLSIIQNVTSKNVTDFNLLIYQLNDLNSNLKKNIYSVAGACNKVCTITTLLSGFTVDTNKPFYVDLNLGMQNHIERYIVSHKYIKNPTLFDSIRNVRTDFGCSTDTSLPCGALMIISIIITILAIGGIVMMTGYAGPGGIAIIALALLGISTYVGWFYWLPYLIMVLAVVFWLGKGVVE